MVATPIKLPELVADKPKTLPEPENLSSEDKSMNPPEGMEWVDGQFIEKTGMTFKHGLTQCKLGTLWNTYLISNSQGGKVLTETPCRTQNQTRRPDVSYLTAEQVDGLDDFVVFPQSFPLIGEIVSPDDPAEAVFAKANEYLQSGCEEIWLLYPGAKVVIIVTQERWSIFHAGDVSTQVVLPGFSTTIEALFT